MEDMTAMEKVKALYTSGLAASLREAAEMLVDMGEIEEGEVRFRSRGPA